MTDSDSDDEKENTDPIGWNRPSTVPGKTRGNLIEDYLAAVKVSQETAEPKKDFGSRE